MEASSYTSPLIIALIAAGLIFLHLSRKKVQWTSKMLAHGSMALALSFVLSYIKFFSMGSGGSVTGACSSESSISTTARSDQKG